MYRIEDVNSGSLREWQAFVDAQANAHPLHHAAWYNVLRESSVVEPWFTLARSEDGTIRAVLPAYASRSILSGFHVTSFDGGALAVEPAASIALVSHLHERTASENARYLLLRGGPEGSCAAAVHEHRSVSTIVDTACGEEEIWRRIKKKTRWDIRRGRKEGFFTRLDPDFTEIDVFYRLYAAHVHRLGTPVMSAVMMRSMVRYLGYGKLRLILVKREGETVGGMLIILARRMWLDLYALVRHDLRHTAANYVLYAEALRIASEEGASLLNLGRSTIGSGVHAFKTKWGGTDEPLIYRYYPGSNGGKLPGLDHFRDRETLAQRMWKRMPLWAANQVGPILRRQLPFI